MNFEEARSYILERLSTELSPGLFYHSLEHTLDVLESAIRIAKKEQFTGSDMLLIKTAALYHDAGMLLTYDGHEKASAEIARSVLPGFGYSAKQIAAVEGMIMATQLPQNPQNKQEEVLCDADLDYLGRDDFFMISHRLKQEWHIRGHQQSLKEWYIGQIAFLSNHVYFTDSAKQLRRPKKIDNLDQIKALFSE